jgi:hypothetical protein
MLTAAGNAGMVQVSVEDANGSVVIHPAVFVTLTVTGPAGYSQMYTSKALNGIAGFDVSAATLTAAGVYTFTATSTTLTVAAALTTVTAGPATQYTVSAISATLTGTPVAVTVTAYDIFGNIATGYSGTVQLTSTDGSAILGANAVLTSGTGVFSATFAAAGTQTVTATDTATSSITGTSGAILVMPTDIWVLNSSGSLSELYDSGLPQQHTGSAIPGGSGTAAAGGVAFDSAGQVWSVNVAANQLVQADKTGASVNIFTAGSLNAPVALAIDGNGTAWIANSNGSVSAFTSGGISLDPASGFTGGGMNAPTGIAIDISGNVWVSNSGNNSVTEILGGAAPVAPLAIATQNAALGVHP